MRLSRHLIIGVLLIAAPALAEDRTPEKLSTADAAELAAELKVQASAVRLDARSDAEETMQSYVDQMATIATLLEAEIRAGRDKGATQELYRELRRIRLEVLELASSGKVELPTGSAELFEKLMSDLGRYHLEAQ